MVERRTAWVILFTLLAAFALSILPMPGWAEPWRPEWTALVIIYWVMALPKRAGVVLAFSVGLFLDVLSGTLLGQYALALAVGAWIAAQLHLQVRNFPLWQQTLTVFAIVAIVEFLLFWVDGIAGYPGDLQARAGRVLTSALLWPVVFVLLRDLRRRYRLA